MRKLLLLGDPNSGKTSFCLRILHNAFLKSPPLTPPQQLEHIHHGKFNGSDILFIESGLLWKKILFRCFQDSSLDGIIVCFDVTRRHQFQQVFENYIKEIDQLFDMEKVPVFLLGTKIDLVTKRQVTKEMVFSHLNDQLHRIQYFELSNGDGTNALYTMESILHVLNARDIKLDEEHQSCIDSNVTSSKLHSIPESDKHEDRTVNRQPSWRSKRKVNQALNYSNSARSESSSTLSRGKHTSVSPEDPEISYRLQLLRCSDSAEVEAIYGNGPSEQQSHDMFHRCVNAIQQGDLETLKEILIDVLDLELVQDENGRTLLHYACLLNQTKIVKFLLMETKARVDATDHQGYTPLLLACRSFHPEMARRLLQSNAFVNVCEKENKFTPLHFAVLNRQPRMVTLLMKHNADVEARNAVGETPLHLAAITNCEILKPMLKRHPNLEIKDEEGLTPLVMAASFGRKSIVELLLSNKALAHPSIVKEKPAASSPSSPNSARNGSLFKPSNLFQRFARNNLQNVPYFSALHAACQHGHLEVVQLLVEKGGAPVNCVEPTHGYSPLIFAAERGEEKIVRFLLHYNADIMFRTPDGKTVLHYAIQSGNSSLVKYILREKPVLARRKDNEGYDSLKMACFSPAGVDICHLLLSLSGECAVDLNGQTSSGKTALHLAVLFGAADTIELLLECGIDPHIKTNQECTALELTMNTSVRNVLLKHVLLDPTISMHQKKKYYFSTAVPAKIADALHEEGLLPHQIFHEILQQVTTRQALREAESLTQLKEMCTSLKNDFALNRVKGRNSKPSRKNLSEFSIAIDAMFEGKKKKLEELRIIESSSALSGFYQQLRLKLFELFLQVSILSSHVTLNHEEEEQQKKNHLQSKHSRRSMKRVQRVRLGTMGVHCLDDDEQGDEIIELHAGSQFVRNCNTLLNQYVNQPLDAFNTKKSLDYNLTPFGERVFKFQLLSEHVSLVITTMYQFQILVLTSNFQMSSYTAWKGMFNDLELPASLLRSQEDAEWVMNSHNISPEQDQMNFGGAEMLAHVCLRRIMERIEQGHLLLRIDRETVARRLIRSVFRPNLSKESWYALPTQGKRPLMSGDLLDRCGIRLLNGECYSYHHEKGKGVTEHACDSPDMYGYRLGTMEEIKKLHLTLDAKVKQHASQTCVIL